MHTDGRTSALFRRLRVGLAVGLALGPWLAGAALLPTEARAEIRILCLGDSLTEGMGVEPEEAYPAVLERRLRASGHDVRVVNAGIGGATTGSAVWRLRWQLRARPDVVILALGANDPLMRIPLRNTRRNLEASVALALRSGARVVLAGIRYPTSLMPRYTRPFARMYPEIARRYRVPLVPFLLEGVFGKPDLNLKDRLHPNAAGYEIVVDNVIPVLVPVLEDLERRTAVASGGE